MLLKIFGKNGFELPKKPQEYFSSIPDASMKKLLSIKRKAQHLTGTQFVMRALEGINEEIGDDCKDIENKVAAYMLQVKNTNHTLLNVGGRIQCEVAMYDINLAFYRVLYKEWYQGRWDGVEIPLSRIILSVSEPYVFLQSPRIWPYQENKLLNKKIDDFESQGESDKEVELKKVFSMGINDEEIVIGGILDEYSYKKEFEGFMTTYLDVPGMERGCALNMYERNLRLLLHRSDEFLDSFHFNILVYNTGVESFKGSCIRCMFSPRILELLGWRIVFKNGLELLNSNDETIGRFEYFHGLRTDMGNHVYRNQPVIQRWVIEKRAYTEMQNMFSCELKQVADAKIFSIPEA